MTKFKKYRRTKIAEIRHLTTDEIKNGLSDNISISPADKKNGHPRMGDMIARNPKNHNDKWLIAKKYFKDNFEPVKIKNL